MADEITASDIRNKAIDECAKLLEDEAATCVSYGGERPEELLLQMRQLEVASVYIEAATKLRERLLPGYKLAINEDREQLRLIIEDLRNGRPPNLERVRFQITQWRSRK